MPTSEERVRAALSGEVIDRPPISMWGHHYVDEWFVDRLADLTVRETVEYGWDWIKVHGRLSFLSEGLGCDFRPAPNGATHPVLMRRAVTKKSDWFDVIDRANSTVLPAVLAEQIDVVRKIKASAPADVPIVQSVFSPVSLLGHLVGRDHGLVKLWLRDEPALMQRVLHALSGYIGRFAAASMGAGADGLFVGIYLYATEDFTDEETYREKLLPFDRRVLEHVSDSWFTMVHACGGNIFFELVSDLPTKAVSWSVHEPGNPGITDARSLTDLALVTGIDRKTPISNGTPAEVEAEYRQVLEKERWDGLLLSPDCSVSPWPEKHEGNFRAIRGAVDAAAATRK